MKSVLNSKDMAKILRVTNREFLRNYRALKGKLLAGEFRKIVIRDNGVCFEYRSRPLKHKKITFRALLEKFMKEKPQKRIERISLKWFKTF